MGSNVAKKRQVRNDWAEKIAHPYALTPEACDRIMRNGGPTYRTTCRGHICNQTGARVKRGQCQSYSLRVLNGTPAMVAFRAGSPKKGKSKPATNWSTPSMRVLKWPGTNGYFKCPECNRDTYITRDGEHLCGYCDKTFLVDLSVPSVKFHGFPSYHMCPICHRSAWVESSGNNRCESCGKTFNAER